jgi:hypothetical protein
MADRATVEFGTRSVNIQPEYGSASELSIVLPLDLRAGTNSVRIQHYNNIGSTEAPDWRPGAASNLGAFVLQPVIKKFVKADKTLEVTVTPPVGKQQAAFLLLNEAKEAPDARMVRLPAEKIDDPDTDTLKFDLAAVAKGEYFVRLVVDGAQSALLRDEPSGRFSEPRVTIT